MYSCKFYDKKYDVEDKQGFLEGAVGLDLQEKIY